MTFSTLKSRTHAWVSTSFVAKILLAYSVFASPVTASASPIDTGLWPTRLEATVYGQSFAFFDWDSREILVARRGTPNGPWIVEHTGVHLPDDGVPDANASANRLGRIAYYRPNTGGTTEQLFYRRRVTDGLDNNYPCNENPPTSPEFIPYVLGRHGTGWNASTAAYLSSAFPGLPDQGDCATGDPFCQCVFNSGSGISVGERGAIFYNDLLNRVGRVRPSAANENIALEHGYAAKSPVILLDEQYDGALEYGTTWGHGIYCVPGGAGRGAAYFRFRYAGDQTEVLLGTGGSMTAPFLARHAGIAVDANDVAHTVQATFGAGFDEPPITFTPESRLGSVIYQRWVDGHREAEVTLGGYASGTSIALQPSGEPAVSYWVEEGLNLRVVVRRMVGGVWQPEEVVRSVMARPEHRHFTAVRTSLSFDIQGLAHVTFTGGSLLWPDPEVGVIYGNPDQFGVWHATRYANGSWGNEVIYPLKPVLPPPPEQCPDGPDCQHDPYEIDPGMRSELTFAFHLDGRRSRLALSGAVGNAIDIEVFDTAGRRVTRVEAPMASGKGTIEVRALTLSPGVYMARARDGSSRTAVCRFIVLNY